MDWLKDNGDEFISFIQTAPTAELDALLAAAQFDRMMVTATHDPRPKAFHFFNLAITELPPASGSDRMAIKPVTVDKAGNYEEMPFAA